MYSKHREMISELKPQDIEMYPVAFFDIY